MSALLALLAAAFYGTADFMGGLATRRAPAVAVTLFAQASGLGVLLLYLAVMRPPLPPPTDFAWGALSGVFAAVSLLQLYRALATGVMSVVAPATALAAGALPVLLGLLLGERPGTIALAGMTLAVVAIVLISQEEDRPDAAGQSALRSLALALFAGVLIGLFLIFLTRGTKDGGMWRLVACRAVSISGLGAWALATRGPLRPPGQERTALASGALDMVANALYVTAVQHGMLALATVLVSLYPGATVLLAYGVLGERLRPVQTAGLALALLSAALIATG